MSFIGHWIAWLDVFFGRFPTDFGISLHRFNVSILETNGDCNGSKRFYECRVKEMIQYSYSDSHLDQQRWYRYMTACNRPIVEANNEVPSLPRSWCGALVSLPKEWFVWRKRGKMKWDLMNEGGDAIINHELEDLTDILDDNNHNSRNKLWNYILEGIDWNDKLHQESCQKTNAQL